jgi:hypothetical protein
MALDSHVLAREHQNRPLDQRFLSLPEIHAYNVAKKERSVERGVALKHLRLAATDSGDIAIASERGSATLTHWSFGQLAARAHAPAGYLRALPAELAVIPLQWSMEQEDEEANVLLRRNATGAVQAQSFNSSTYGRIFDASMTAELMRLDLSVWKVPAASYAATDPKRASTLYASDRDCFICLVDDQRPIEFGDERLFRGFYQRNSEVGAAAYEFSAFLYRKICDNRIIWNGTELLNLRIRHTSGGPSRFMHEAKPALQRYLSASTSGTVDTIKRAMAFEVGKDRKAVGAWMEARGFTKPTAAKAVISMEKSGGNERSLWSVIQGLTDVAHDQTYGDERLDLEKAAGKLMAYAA